MKLLPKLLCVAACICICAAMLAACGGAASKTSAATTSETSSESSAPEGASDTESSAPENASAPDSSTEATFPAKFDLRDEGVVTPVKIQNPWQSCWAFAGTAAAESSILSMMKEKGNPIDAKDFDLSEKHLTWFAVQPVIEQVDESQVGEGLYAEGQEGDSTVPYDNGGMPVYITTLFSAGVGPVPEEYFPYRGDSGLTEKQYWDAHPEEGKAYVCKLYGDNFLEGHTMADAVAHPDEEPYKSFLENKIYGEGYLDPSDTLTVDALEDACLRRYQVVQAKTNCYTKLDDWSLPALDANGEPNRNLTAGYTLVDGNQLPDTRITEEPTDPDDPRKWTGVNRDGINAIKGELMKGRGVSATFKADVAVPGAVPDPNNSYMNYDTWAHYTYKDKWPSHAICIVGWDDGYPKENFTHTAKETLPDGTEVDKTEETTPPGDGAWIAKNSWGSETDYYVNETGAEIGNAKWGVKDESGKHTGYFYISYYDKTLQSCESMSFDTDLHKYGDFFVEMYDYMPSETSSDMDTTEQSDTLVKTANVFKNDAESDAVLHSVSTKTARPDATVKYSVYKLNDGFKDPEDGELLGTKTATYDYACFHRENLDDSIVLKDGEAFPIVAEETVEEGGKTLYEYAVNAADAKEYIDSEQADGETDYGIAVVNKGESFIYDGGKWTDWSEYEPRTAISKRYAIDNFSIKAYLVCESEQTAPADEGAAANYQATNDDGFVNTLIGEKVGEGKVTNEEEAKECLMGVMDRLGGDATTELVVDSGLQNKDGTSVYAFTQQAGGVLIPGATVKLIVDKDGQATGIVSSILPGVDAKPVSEWAIDAAGAEKAVADQLKSTGSTAAIVEGATEKVIVPDSKQGGDSVCAWVVYTFQADAEYEDGIYAANYVSAQGEYLYSMPVSGPSDPDALEGESAKSTFDFDAYEPGEMEVTIKLVDGTTKDVTVPVLKDDAAGKVYLADAKRKILCADFAPYAYSGEFKPTEAQDGSDPIDAHEYYTFIRVWDFFDSLGWTGPDGKGTPTLLLMNFVDPTGEPVDNAAYNSKSNGFQVFGFTRVADYGACVDVVAHEFAHCLSGTAMAGKEGKGDPGAINEGYSDVLGNLAEMILDGNAGAWTIAEGLGPDGIMRNMADPRQYAQPEFAFDTYYAPRPPIATGMNDKGGAHTNSSLIAILSYRLDQAGMSPEDQMNFWLNVVLAMTPKTDYPMLAELLPWVMEQTGYSQYVEPLKAAIDEAKLSVTEDPGIVPEGCGVATFDFADIKEAADNGRVSLTFFEAPDANVEKRASTWPMEGTTIAKANLPAGDYYVTVQVGDESGDFKKLIALGEDGWKILDGKDSETIKAAAKVVTVEAGKTLEIPTDGFGAVAAEAFQAIDQMLAEMNAA